MFSLKHLALLTVVLSASLFSGCAGPATPFGSVWSMSTTENKRGLPKKLDQEMFKNPKVEVKFDRPKLQLDSKTTFKFSIHPKDGYAIKSNYKIIIRYNGIDITTSFLRSAAVSYSPTEVTIESAPVYLSSKEEHKIEVLFGSTQSEWNTMAFIESSTSRDIAGDHQ